MTVSRGVGIKARCTCEMQHTHTRTRIHTYAHTHIHGEICRDDGQTHQVALNVQCHLLHVTLHRLQLLCQLSYGLQRVAEVPANSHHLYVYAITIDVPCIIVHMLLQECLFHVYDACIEFDVCRGAWTGGSHRRT